MKFLNEFINYCRARGLENASINSGIEWLEELEKRTLEKGKELYETSLAFIEQYISEKVLQSKADTEWLLAIARYFSVARVDDIAIRLMAYLLPIGVLPDMAKRLLDIEGRKVHDRVMSQVLIPRECSAPEAYPPATMAFVKALENELGKNKAKRILMWNVHGIPAESFADEKEQFLASPSIEDWLEEFHKRQIAVLEKHVIDKTLWYEQKITPKVVEYVRSNQEILAGVKSGDVIYKTKIPYNPDRYLSTKDKLEKRKLACHCPFAVSAIRMDGCDVPPTWCACSAGYEKFIFDAIFEEETDCEVLESVLDGSERCRFSIKIPDRILKMKRI